MQQANAFTDVVDVTGLVLTKLDGTAKGGIVIGVSNELNVPVKYIGVGEQIEDLQVFERDGFVKALFGEG
jgi:fused signal recognition particle receptor